MSVGHPLASLRAQRKITVVMRLQWKEFDLGVAQAQREPLSMCEGTVGGPPGVICN